MHVDAERNRRKPPLRLQQWNQSGFSIPNHCKKFLYITRQSSRKPLLIKLYMKGLTAWLMRANSRTNGHKLVRIPTCDSMQTIPDKPCVTAHTIVMIKSGGCNPSNSRCMLIGYSWVVGNLILKLGNVWIRFNFCGNNHLGNWPYPGTVISSSTLGKWWSA